MDGTISVSLLALNGKPPSRIDVPSTLDVSELRAKVSSYAALRKVCSWPNSSRTPNNKFLTLPRRLRR